MLTAPSTSVPLEGAPWLVNALLIGIPTILGAITALIYALRGRSTPPPEPPHDPANPRRETVPNTAPATIDEKLDAAKELVHELRRDRDETKAELTATAQRHSQELEALRQRHERELSEMQIRLRGQDVYIERLERLLGLGPAGPTDPFPRQQQ